jgi:hypothetical protein
MSGKLYPSKQNLFTFLFFSFHVQIKMVFFHYTFYCGYPSNESSVLLQKVFFFFLLKRKSPLKHWQGYNCLKQKDQLDLDLKTYKPNRLINLFKLEKESHNFFYVYFSIFEVSIYWCLQKYKDRTVLFEYVPGRHNIKVCLNHDRIT